ncbi:hypothetical protein C8J57DRAFT_1236096 [Mycena rebaudengoi]|nr:hypothetical protein C8J57DRAFT_1236096 [Mycena rebaudengoi]
MTFATINCIAVLENPRKTDAAKPKTIALDGQVFLDGSSPSLIGFFRYYNATDIQFETDVPEAYMVWAKVSKMENQVELCQEGLKHDEYHIMGDIILVGVPQTKSRIFSAFSYAPLESSPSWGRPIQSTSVTTLYFTRSGLCRISINKTTPLTWFISHQVHIPTTGRFKQNKPYPSNNSRVQVVGWIIDVVCSDDRSVKHLIVDLESIIFLPGRSGEDGATLVQKLIKTEGTPARLRFNGFTSSPLASKNLKHPSRDDDDDKGDGSSTGVPGLASRKRKQTN